MWLRVSGAPVGLDSAVDDSLGAFRLRSGASPSYDGGALLRGE